MLAGSCTLQHTCSSISTKHSRVIILVCPGLTVPTFASFTALSSLSSSTAQKSRNAGCNIHDSTIQACSSLMTSSSALAWLCPHLQASPPSPACHPHTTDVNECRMQELTFDMVQCWLMQHTAACHRTQHRCRRMQQHAAAYLNYLSDIVLSAA